MVRWGLFFFCATFFFQGIFSVAPAAPGQRLPYPDRPGRSPATLVEPGDGLDRALIVLEAVFLVGIAPLITLDHELEGALADVPSGDKLQHVVAKGSLRSLELETKSDLVHGEL